MTQANNNLDNLDTQQSFDAQQQIEDISAGEEKQPEVDVDHDYEVSKEYSVSDVDKENH